MHIKFSEYINSHPQDFGNKTISLVKLKTNRFNVPDFVALDVNTTSEIAHNAELAKIIQDEISENFNHSSYAVRSSGLIEDSKEQSLAGQFLTKLDVSQTQLADAITEVITQSEKLVPIDSKNFSIIIQSYINPDYSGVFFTRNPQGTRDAVFEYSTGEGEKLVSGKTKPERLKFYRENSQLDFEIVNSAEEFKSIFFDIEKLLEFPQDIEWCMKDNKLYILQSRPITTLSTKQIAGFTFLDEYLKNKTDYYLYKNDISAIIPRPSPLNIEILELIYGQNGPIDKIYKKYKVSYNYQKFWEIVGNELFIDRNLELKTLLPGFYFDINNHTEKLDLHQLPNILNTYKNIVKLMLIKPDRSYFDQLLIKIEENLTEVNNPKELTANIQKFLRSYELVFEINLLAEKAIKDLHLLLKKEPVSLELVLNGDLDKIGTKLNLMDVPMHMMQGNSLDLLDISEFKRTKFKSQANQNFQEWFALLDSTKQTKYLSPISTAQNFNKLREVGRWVTVKSISLVRQTLTTIAEKHGFENPILISYALISEVKNNKLDKDQLRVRHQEYTKYNEYSLPNILSSTIKETPSLEEFVSGDKIEGILADENTLNDYHRPVILLTQNLTPSLSQYFDQIDGIISQNGSLLSHLAIIAREKNLPVVISDKFNTYVPGTKIVIQKKY